MKKDINSKVLAFLKMLPISYNSSDQKKTLTEEDEARIKIMLNNSINPQAQTDREALKKHILNLDSKGTVEITDADREAIATHLRKYAPEFYKLLSKTTS